jgi:hypothetical protein
MKMKKGLINLVVCTLVIGSITGLRAEIWPPPPPDELDQWFEPNDLNPTPLVNGNVYAQSFTPSKDKLTRVQLYLSKTSGYPDSLEPIVSLCRYIDHYVITDEVEVNPQDIPLSNPGWVEINFEDVPLISEDDKYFIVIRPLYSGTNDWITWWYSTGDPYDNRGSSWECTQSTGWVEYPNLDFMFRTYGANEGGTPQIVVEPTTLDLGSGGDNEILSGNCTVHNNGSSPLYWEIDLARLPEWLYDITPKCFDTLSPQETITLTIKVDTSKADACDGISQFIVQERSLLLRSGTTYQENTLIYLGKRYSGTIYFLSNGGTDELTITFRVSYSSPVPSPL